MIDKFNRQLVSSLSATQEETHREHPGPETLNAFRELKVPPGTRDTVAAHLASCADCREILFLSAPLSAASVQVEPATTRLSVCAGLAAALVLLAAGLTSRADRGLPSPPALVSYQPAYAPVLAYTSAQLVSSGTPSSWRIRHSGTLGILESSSDGGKTWHAAKVDHPFEPKSVGFRGPDVWVIGASGDTLLSRDGGAHWIRRKPVAK